MPREDAAQPEFWEKRFREGFTPWDAGRAPATLEQFLKTQRGGQRVLIPGCGSGYEVRAFAEAGFEVLAIDFAPAAVEQAQRILGPLSELVRLEDFFKFDPKGRFDLVYEAGFEVLAIDFAPAAVEQAQRILGPLSELVRLEDFFKFDPKGRFDLVYERAF